MQDLQKLFWFFGNFSSISLNLKTVDDRLKIEVIEDAIKSQVEIEHLEIKPGESKEISLGKKTQILKELDTLLQAAKFDGFSPSVTLSKIYTSNISMLLLDIIRIGKNGAISLVEAIKMYRSFSKLRLCNISNLISLLGNTQIGKEGAIVLAEALKINHSLTKLDLGNISILISLLDWNQIGKEGVIVLAEAFKVNHSLTKLILSNILILISMLVNNKIGKEGAIAIAKALKVNNSLTKLNLCNISYLINC